MTIDAADETIRTSTWPHTRDEPCSPGFQAAPGLTLALRATVRQRVSLHTPYLCGSTCGAAHPASQWIPVSLLAIETSPNAQHLRGLILVYQPPTAESQVFFDSPMAPPSVFRSMC